MSYLVVFVLDDPDLCGNVLEAWENTGVKGITIMESTGLNRVRRAGIRDDVPLMPSFMDLIKTRETHHRTLFSVVETEEQSEQLLKATEEIVGDIHQPHTGLFFVVPLLKVYGITNSDESG